LCSQQKIRKRKSSMSSQQEQQQAAVKKPIVGTIIKPAVFATYQKTDITLWNSAQCLYNILQDTSQTKLVIDLRSSKLYDKGRARTAISVEVAANNPLIAACLKEDNVQQGEEGSSCTSSVEEEEQCHAMSCNNQVPLTIENSAELAAIASTFATASNLASKEDYARFIDENFVSSRLKQRNYTCKKIIMYGFPLRLCLILAYALQQEQQLGAKAIDHIFILNPELSMQFDQVFAERYPYMVTTASKNAVPKPYASEVLKGFMFLGSFENASNATQLQDLGITRIVNMASELENCFEGKTLGSSETPFEVKYLKLGIDDSVADSVAQTFELAYEFLVKCKEEKQRVLVHCNMGISRSTSVVVMYLMKQHKMTYAQAYEYVKKCRSFVRPNPKFVSELEELEKTL